MSSSEKTQNNDKDVKEDPLTVIEIEQIAQKKLSKNVWEYYACGSDDQLALARNAEVYNRYSKGV
jgi:(S)-2-hydroxy-acid oxidase